VRNGGRDVFVHAYCTPQRRDALTVTVSNPNPEVAAIDIEVRGRNVTKAEQWTISAELTATEATINGEGVNPDGSIPDPPGEAVAVTRGIGQASVPAHGVAVIVVDLNRRAGACATG
jgi:hypothetical protein